MPNKDSAQKEALVHYPSPVAFHARDPRSEREAFVLGRTAQFRQHVNGQIALRAALHEASIDLRSDGEEEAKIIAFLTERVLNGAGFITEGEEEAVDTAVKHAAMRAAQEKNALGEPSEQEELNEKTD